MEKKVKNSWGGILKKIFLICIISIGLILLPFAIEWILYDTEHILFNAPINFSREVWFGFIASYLGAIGTVLLGIIALYQNKRYKELSDESENRFIELQAEIKELNKKNVELIEINTKIERAKYYPNLSELSHYYWDISKENLSEHFNLENSFQITIKKEGEFDKREEGIEKIFDDYHTFVYALKNEGEKAIRNFTCSSVKINNISGMGVWFYYPCDIEPGEIVYIVYATKMDLMEQIKADRIHFIDFEYKMENVIGEMYTMSTKAYFYNIDEKIASTRLEMQGIRKEDC